MGTQNTVLLTRSGIVAVWGGGLVAGCGGNGRRVCRKNGVGRVFYTSDGFGGVCVCM